MTEETPGDGVTVTYLPPPPPARGRYVIKAPLDRHGHPQFPTLYLSEAQAVNLHAELGAELYGEESTVGDPGATGEGPPPE